MSAPIKWPGFLVLAMATASISLVGNMHSQKPQTSGPSLQLSGSAEIADSLVLLTGAVGPKDFFTQLSKSDTPSGPKFTRGPEEVTYFPEQLTIWLVAVGPIATGQKAVKSALNHDTMKSLKFQAYWKRGLELRPVKNLTLTDPPTVRKAPKMETWTYVMEIRQSDIPLTDHLIIEVLRADDTRITRLSASL